MGYSSDEIDQAERELMQRLRSVYADKRWILAGEVAQGIAGGVLTARSFGASDEIAIASRYGVGEVPDDVRFIISDGTQLGPDASMIERMHENNRELHNLPDWVIAEVDEWDPDQQAQVIVSFTIDAGHVANRPTFGARKLEWAKLENKITIRDLWKRAGIATAPDHVLDLSESDSESAAQAHRDIGSELGSVWAADNKQGWHGGGDGTHWVTSENDAIERAERLAGRHDHVRVQPFLAGVPCSIHGMVLRDRTLVFRPCETIMLLDRDAQSFEYARTATFWDPSPEDRAEMRATASRVGDTLRDMVDYRGVFTLDGVLTDNGFRPTEVNPRFGAALPPKLPTADGDQLPLFFTHLAAVTGNLDDLDPDLIEAVIVGRIDANRFGSAFIRSAEAPPGGQETSVAVTGDWGQSRFVNIREAADDDDPIAIANWGTDPRGGLIFCTFTEHMRSGPPVAPTIVEIRHFLDKHWNLGLRPFVAACTAHL